MKLTGIIAGSLFGAIALSVLTPLFHWLFFRSALGDGQYAFVFFVTVPLGIILGGLTGLVRAYLTENQIVLAGRIAQSGGGFLTVLFLLLGLFVFSGTQNPSLLERLSATMFWFGLALLWSGLLFRTGWQLLAKH